jgi:regulatory protein YycH of two-component signal transduction system YycFG
MYHAGGAGCVYAGGSTMNDSIKQALYNYMCKQPHDTHFSPAILNHEIPHFEKEQIKRVLISLWLDGKLSYKRPYYRVIKAR